MKKKLRCFESPLVFAALVFLANPVFGVVDILPDVIGGLLLYAGLTEISYIDSRIDTARSRSLYLAAVNGIKLLLTPAIITGGVSSDLLAATAFFGVAETLLLFMIFGNLYEGLSESVSLRGNADTLRAFDGARTLALFFIGVKAGLTILPEFSALFEIAALTDITNAELYLSIAAIKNYFYVLSAFVVLALGIWWLTNTAGMLRSVRRDSAFVESVAASYSAAYLERPAARMCKRLNVSKYFVVLGLLFYITIDMNGTNILPEFIGSALIIAGLALLARAACFRSLAAPAFYAVAVQTLAYFYRENKIDIYADLFRELGTVSFVASVIIGLMEAASFVWLAAAASDYFGAAADTYAPPDTSRMLYGLWPVAAVYACIHTVMYALPIWQGYLWLPDTVCIIVAAVIVCGNYRLVTGQIKYLEESEKFRCADSSASSTKTE